MEDEMDEDEEIMPNGEDEFINEDEDMMEEDYDGEYDDDYASEDEPQYLRNDHGNRRPHGNRPRTNDIIGNPV
eukprot:CAMPEP_0116880466 /NCGR_PEP_ID=MMETSP0463-20121206/12399_1 /TAXON_ID=181622 /ORGANISM="Strombidinopsis sp, Strain SopsisLIS2011" /LENGTH=72 /DNA_ID=CAMNT_0004531081 /DNA_START=413 /DNA_END=631 /DNA_ORIENTATION=+